MDIQQGKYGRLPLDSNCPFQLEVPLPAPFDQILHAPDSVMDPKALEGRWGSKVINKLRRLGVVDKSISGKSKTRYVWVLVAQQ